MAVVDIATFVADLKDLAADHDVIRVNAVRLRIDIRKDRLYPLP